MKLVAEKYRKLKPEIDLLTDEVVISQAWKKTHGYMRAHNWYADTLALDISALGLESNAEKWANALTKNDIELRDLELVPAAKSEPWGLDSKKGWVPLEEPKIRESKPPVRPLAHMTVRDQTWATALMMCLADAVESAQGDCSILNASLAQNQGVYSYGNRLLCDWTEQGAWFRWGNGETYRKFFTDYQNFLKRPIEIGRLVANSLSDTDHVFIVNLDLSKFYDYIDRPTLLKRLQNIAVEYGDADVCKEFWKRAKKITDWRWDVEAVDAAKKIGLELGSGLPQGLVASGFFANAYMIPFDRSVAKYIGESVPNMADVILHDYCRYVDDIRLVISAGNIDIDKIAKAINTWVGNQLKLHAGTTLKLNIKKTKLTSLSDLDNSGSLSGRIMLLQNELSGPADRDILESATAVLEGLLTSQPDDVPETTSVKGDKGLFRLVKFDHDIRLDTLKRFAANRLESVMRNKRKLTVIDKLDGQAGNLADNESELLAKKLVKAWMQDPSLGLVLRKAIEIFPSPIIIEPVLDAIFKRSSIGGGGADRSTAAMMDYLLADIFRCCVDFNGFFQRVDYPKSAAPEDLLDIAAMYAQRSVGSPNVPRFIERQALLLLATLKKPVLVDNATKTIQHSLHAILAGRPPEFQIQRLALFEVASQITGRPDAFALLLIENISPLTPDLKLSSLEEIAKRGGEFWLSVWKRLGQDSANKELIKQLDWAAPVASSDLKSKKQKLSKVIASNKNGFEHEVALVKLALGLISFAEKNSALLPLSPRDIQVAQVGHHADWEELWLPDVTSIDCTTTSKSTTNDPRFSAPPWIDASNNEHTIIYWIGSILRAAVVGGSDFTGSRWKLGTVISYKGLRTGWYKRRMGMMHSSEVLVGNYATVSTWFSELLMKCLQWPGRESTYLKSEEILGIDGLESLRKVLSKRLRLLDELYCKASRMPTLVTSISTLTKRPSFRLVTVQQLLPRSKDFSLSDRELNLPKARAENRAHIARICQLTYKTLTAKLEADNDLSKVSADLIVFPEVAVHPDDQDIIKRLADKTKSIVLAGMVFFDHNGKLVNVARWFIPDYRDSGRQWIIRDQGKANMTKDEVLLGISGYRPCQHIIEVIGAEEGPIRISGAICYDATDLNLAVDLKKKTDLFVVCAHNKDVSTFDTMAAALNYHMFQHVVVVNKGEFGGSTIQAPYKEHFDRLVSHAHGVDQISINVADLDLVAFRREHKSFKPVKTKPAGF
ncbi:reverse transcriptase domain-containing protein [Undibacterium parvum]|uniref:Reverse transcriptase domain-containing protein n=2 Tax=Undibacterium TaxID=401469 RepID=A0A6M4A3F7_9BURK|nr:reverse transcriptase domain-containing protein [Undibacterium parvum]AZP11212.1 hypothetical protein EJN92_03845 [Undibacterium parvum]QJQ05735.1 hypothetical protein EJG51_007575 [Undibacterium piscinae]